MEDDLKVSELNYEDLNEEYIDRILYDGIIDDNKNGDCILVFGSRSAIKYRVPKAVELYKAGRAKKILLSGGKVIEHNNELKMECQIMKEKAIELGVNKDDLIEESISIKSTKENVLASLLILDREFGLNNIKRILVVSTTYHMRRCMMMLETYMPDWIQFSMCGANDTRTNRDNWFLNDEGYKRAKLEAYKISCYIREGSIKDFEI